MLCCSCLENIVPKTVVFILSTLMMLIGLTSCSLGVYTWHKHKSDSFFDAYMRDEFNTTDAMVYILELRMGDAAPDLEVAFENFADNFDTVVRKTIIDHAFDPRGNDDENTKLSDFLLGFRHAALCEENCTRDSSSDWIANAINKKTAGIDETMGFVEWGVNLIKDAGETGVDLKNKIEELAEDTQRRLVRRLSGSDSVDDALERRRAGDDNEDLVVSVAPITADPIDMDNYYSGYDLANVIRDFRINYVVLLVLGVAFLVMGALTCKSLVNRWIAFALALVMYIIGVFLFLQYGQSQGWEFCEKALSKINVGGVFMTASDELRKNETAKLAIDSLLGFYKPYYLAIGSAIVIILGTMFLKLAFCSNLSTNKKGVFD